jgi:hypothetical protein
VVLVQGPQKLSNGSGKIIHPGTIDLGFAVLKITGCLDLHSILETGSVSPFRWGGGIQTLLGLLERTNLNNWITHFI